MFVRLSTYTRGTLATTQNLLSKDILLCPFGTYILFFKNIMWELLLPQIVFSFFGLPLTSLMKE